MSADEESAVQQLQASLTYDGGRYVVSILKRSSIASLPNNHGVAAVRLERKLSQLERAPARYQRYHDELMKFVERGHAVEIRGNLASVFTAKTHPTTCRIMK